MYKVLNKMAAESLTKLFTYKNVITNHKRHAFPPRFVYHNHEQITRKIVSCMMVHTYGFLFQIK